MDDLVSNIFTSERILACRRSGVGRHGLDGGYYCITGAFKSDAAKAGFQDGGVETRIYLFSGDYGRLLKLRFEVWKLYC